MNTFFLSMEEVLELHRMLLEQFGGRRGVRDAGLAESALHRPQSGYYKSLSTQAAALLQSFALNHAFVDGNKRVAFAATAVFLSVNGFRLEVGPDEAEEFMVQSVIQRKVDLETITQWLESHMRPKK
jgi:death on curing protein